MSNRLFQNIAHQTSEVLGKVVGVVDKSSTIIACSDVSRMGESLNLINENLMATSEPFVVGAYTCKSFGDASAPDRAVFITSTDESAKRDAEILAVAMNSVYQNTDEKKDRLNFIKNVLLDTVDHSVSREFLDNVEAVLSGRKLDYLIVNHMEPDHCSVIAELVIRYPELAIVGNAKTIQMIKQFYSHQTAAFSKPFCKQNIFL